MNNLLLVFILLNLISKISVHTSCCQGSLCERISLKYVPHCLNGSMIRKLRLGYNEIEELYESSFKDFHGVTFLHLNNNQLSQINVNVFRNLTKLDTLFLNHNLLDYLPKELFQDLKHLKALYLHHNKFIRIPIILSSSLVRLHFGHNKITSVSFPKEYLNCRNLKSIDLNDNYIYQVSKDDLVNIRNSPIEVFKLKRNKLSNVKDNNFYYIRKKLRHCVISKNFKLLNSGLKALFDSFDHSRHKQNWHLEFDASGVGLTIVTADLFNSLENIFLIKLVLADNYITRIDAGFGKLIELRRLDLSGNRLTTLIDGQFSDVLNLRTLDLKDNSIEKIAESAFSNLYQLDELDMANNKIKYLNTITFANLSSLNTLNLRGNGIITLSSCGDGSFLLNNRFITNNQLNITTLCFTSQDCVRIIKNKVEFGFNIDVSSTLCHTNVSNALIVSPDNNKTFLTNEKISANITMVYRKKSAMYIVNTFNGTKDVTLKKNSSNIELNNLSNVSFLDNNSTNKSVKLTAKNSLVTLTTLLVFASIVLAIFFAVLVCGKCFLVKYSSNQKSIKHEISVKVSLDTLSNIYESIPESDIST